MIANDPRLLPDGNLPLASRPDEDLYPSFDPHPMAELIKALFRERAPKVELADGSVDEATPRALDGVQIVLMGQVIAGVLSETVIPGVYRLMMPSKNSQTGATTLCEVFFPADKVTSVYLERADLAEQARQQKRQQAGQGGNGSKIWTP